MNYYCDNCGYISDTQINQCPICGVVKFNSTIHKKHCNDFNTENLRLNNSLLQPNLPDNYPEGFVYDLLHIQDNESQLPEEQKGKRLERFLFYLFSSSGYAVIDNHPNGKKADGGIDLIAQKDGTIFAIQAKHKHVLSTNLIGSNIVDSLYGAIGKYAVSHSVDPSIIKGVIITTHFFSAAAKESADKLDIELIDKKGLVELIYQLQPRLIAKAYYMQMVSELRICKKCGEVMVLKYDEISKTHYWAHPEYKLANQKNCTLTMSYCDQ